MGQSIGRPRRRPRRRSVSFKSLGWCLVRVAYLQVETGEQDGSRFPRLAVWASKAAPGRLRARAEGVIEQWPGRRFAP